MKPDRKFMRSSEDENEFIEFNTVEPFNSKDSNWKPVIDITDTTLENFRSFDSSDPTENQNSLSYSLNDIEYENDFYRNELFCYNTEDCFRDDSSSYPYGVPTPTEVLRDIDLDVNYDTLMAEKNYLEYENLYSDLYDETELRQPPGRPPVQNPNRPPSRPPVQNPNRPPSRPPVQNPNRPPNRPPIRPPFFPPNRCNPEVIFNMMLRNNPDVMATMRRFGMPFPIAKSLTKRIISLSLFYCGRQGRY